jgi:tetratricopeptide (TPR) repeat protein
MDVRPKLIELLERTQDEEEAFVAQLTAQERERVGKVDDWSAKDLIAHLAGWKLRMADRLAALGRGETAAQTDEIDAENALIWSEYSDRSWEEVVQASSLGHRRLIDDLQAMLVDDLHDADRFESQKGQPLWRSVAGNGCTHPMMHLAEAHVRRGQAARATAMMESLSEGLAQLDESPRWVGVVRYNLACYLALAGEKNRAIEILGDALRLHPGLIEWSRQDTDLASLHGLPGYERLYAS